MSEREPNLYPPPDSVAKSALVSRIVAYSSLVAKADIDYSGCWSRLGRELVTWN